MTASGGAGGLGGAQTVNVSQAQAAAAAEDVKEIIGSQESSEASMIKGNDDFTNPAAATRVKKKEEKFQSLEARRKTTDKSNTKSESTEEKGDTPLEDRFTEDLSEVSGQDFKGLKNELSDESSSDDVLELLSQKFSDPTIKNLALDYLITTSPPDGKLRAALIQAKQTLFQQNPQAIVGGRNVLIASEAFASKANTSPSSLRSLYLQVLYITSNALFLHT